MQEPASNHSFIKLRDKLSIFFYLVLVFHDNKSNIKEHVCTLHTLQKDFCLQIIILVERGNFRMARNKKNKEIRPTFFKILIDDISKQLVNLIVSK